MKRKLPPGASAGAAKKKAAAPTGPTEASATADACKAAAGVAAAAKIAELQRQLATAVQEQSALAANY